MKTVHVLTYEHIDDWHGISDPITLERLVKDKSLPCSLEKVKVAFSKLGWEGDGQVEAFWVPPFVIEERPGLGLYLWHVKQSANGISFLCADEPYDFCALYKSPDWTAVEVDEVVEESNPDHPPF